jgi:hypothetical protein
MKNKILLTMLFVVFSLGMMAQNSIITQWKELNNYDALLKKTYRLAEVGDLKPIRANAEVLVDFAHDITDETLSVRYNKLKNNDKLKLVVQQTEELQQAIKKKEKNEELFKRFTKLRNDYKKFIREIEIKD